MSRAPLAVACALLLLAPFGEGGRAPLILVILQTLVLAFVLLVALEPRRRSPPAWSRGGPGAVAGLAVVAIVLSILATARADYPFAAALALTDILAAAGLLLAALSAGASDGDLKTLRVAAVASTALQAAIAIALDLIRGRAAAGEMFLNPNHLAAFLNVGLLLCMAGAEAAPSIRGRIVWGGTAGMHLAAIAILSSRGGFAGILMAGLVWAAVRWRNWRGTGRAAVTAALVGVIALGGVMIARRFAAEEDPYRYARLSIWKASLGLVVDKPLIGHGPGMFPHLSPRYNFPVDQGPIRYGRTFQGAHDTLLTFAAEDGTPFALCLLGGALLSVGLLIRRARRGSCDAAIMGIAAGLVALLTQGLVDDLQQRPALTLVAALLAGAALGAIRKHACGGLGAGEAAGGGGGAARRRGLFRAAALVLGGVIYFGPILLPYLADREADAARSLGRQGLARMERAARLNPWHPEYRHDLAMGVLNSGPFDPDRYAQAALNLMEAARLKPTDYRFPLLLARLEERVAGTLFGDQGAARRATALYERAVRLTPLDPRPLLELAGHLVALGRLDEGSAATARALEIEPNFLRARILQVSVLTRLDRKEEAQQALRALEATVSVLKTYEPDSSYARDLTQDAPVERRRLMGPTVSSPPVSGDAATR